MWAVLATPADAAALAIAVIATATDLRHRRIPNALTLAGALAGLIYSVATAGGSGAVTSLEGWGVGLLLWLPIYALGGMGAGDVKLLACVGAWLGPGAVLRVAIYASIAGGALAVAVALRHRYLRTAYQNVWVLLATWRVSGITPIDTVTLENSKGPRLAYAVPILAGTAVAVYLR
jgi:prepilin peptidase CpaA